MAMTKTRPAAPGASELSEADRQRAELMRRRETAQAASAQKLQAAREQWLAAQEAVAAHEYARLLAAEKAAKETFEHLNRYGNGVAGACVVELRQLTPAPILAAVEAIETEMRLLGPQKARAWNHPVAPGTRQAIQDREDELNSALVELEQLAQNVPDFRPALAELLTRIKLLTPVGEKPLHGPIRVGAIN